MPPDLPGAPRLLALYHRYLGEPDRSQDVYVGFALFFSGIALGVIGLVVFLWSNTVSPTDAGFWQLREIAIAFTTLGLPAFLLGIVVLLPVSSRMVSTASAGVALCVVALGVFVGAYPHQWNVVGTTDYSVYGIVLYSAGLTMLAASTGAVLVAYHLERARPTPVSSTTASEPDGESVSDEQVQRDIHDAMATTDISWGGVDRTDTRRLRVRSDDEHGFDPGAFETARFETVEGPGVDEAVAELSALRRDTPTTTTGRGTEDQTAALVDLRDRHDPAPTEQSTPVRNLLAELRDRFR